MNARTRTAVPNAEEGMLCHKALANLDHRCPDCPAKEIRQTKNGENSVFSTHLGLSVLTEASLISWGNQDACLITCRELPRQKGTE